MAIESTASAPVGNTGIAQHPQEQSMSTAGHGAAESGTTMSATLRSQHIGVVLDALARNSIQSIMVSDATPGTPVVYVNEAFTRLTGYAAAEVVGKSPGLLQGPETDRAVVDRLRDDMAAGRVFEGMAVNYRKDGSAFTMHWRVVPVTDTSGTPVYFLACQEQVGRP
jgi:PAS domain S-box-containing protein